MSTLTAPQGACVAGARCVAGNHSWLRLGQSSSLWALGWRLKNCLSPGEKGSCTHCSTNKFPPNKNMEKQNRTDKLVGDFDGGKWFEKLVGTKTRATRIYSEKLWFPHLFIRILKKTEKIKPVLLVIFFSNQVRIITYILFISTTKSKRDKINFASRNFSKLTPSCFWDCRFNLTLKHTY